MTKENINKLAEENKVFAAQLFERLIGLRECYGANISVNLLITEDKVILANSRVALKDDFENAGFVIDAPEEINKEDHKYIG